MASAMEVHKFSKFANDTKLCGAVDTLEGEDAIQRDLDRLETRAHANLMKFNKAKCKVLHVGQGNPSHKYRLGEEQIERCPEEKDLGVLIDEKLNTTQQKANSTLGSVSSSVVSRLREGILSLCSTQVRPPLGVLHPALEPSAQERYRPVETGLEEGTKMM